MLQQEIPTVKLLHITGQGAISLITGIVQALKYKNRSKSTVLERLYHQNEQI